MNQKRRLGKRIISCFLSLVMVLSIVNLPAFTYVVHADDENGHKCGVCGEWKVNDVFVCDDCDYCEVCHVDEDYEHDGRCPECGSCYFSAGDYCETSGLCIDCCIEYQTHCESCDHCYCGETDPPICEDCGKCSECEDWCEHCKRCEDDWDYYHCELCGNCFENDEYGQCESGDYHCQECCEYNEWICEACGECMEAKGMEACDICGRCEECCEATRCPDCGMCEEETDFDEHFCEECGECLENKNICDTCGLCVDCCFENAQALGCECEEYCWTDSDILDHICEDCGTCFGVTDSCDICEKANIRRCVDCCQELSYYYGCDCDDYVCTSSKEWTEHVKRHTAIDGIHVVSPQKSWNANDTMHWRVCRWCDEESHITMKAEHILDGKGRCIVCGFSTLDDILIIGQPRDVTGVVTNDRVEKPSDNTFSLRVNAWGKNGTEGLLYHWYGCNADGTKKYDNLSKIDYVSGVFSRELIVGITSDACTAGSNYYICQITDGRGNEVWTRVATFKARHSYQMLNYKSTDITPEHHVLRCVGDDCFLYDEDARVQAHNFNDWTYEESKDGKGRKYKVCSVCGYKKEVLYHNKHHSAYRGIYSDCVLTMNPEKNDGKYEGYYISEHGEKKEFGGNILWHWETCAEEGCSVKVKENHQYSAYQSIDNAAPLMEGQTVSGYRTCNICMYQDTVLHTGIDASGNIRERVWTWHNHPIVFVNNSGYSDNFIAFEEETIKVYPRFNGKNKVDSVKVTTYAKNEENRIVEVKLSYQVVELEKYREYELKIPKSTSSRDLCGNVIEIEIKYSADLCPHDESKILENAQEATCVKEGYTGDEICSACGAIVVQGKTIPAKRHGRAVAVTESVRKKVWAKGIDGKYGWQDARDHNGYYIYERHAKVTYACTDHQYSEKGSYTGDYECENCGEIIRRGKYIAVEHDYTRADIAVDEWPAHESGYRMDYLVYTLWGAKPLKYPTTTEEGYTGDYICYDCHNIKRGRVIPVMNPKYIDNVSINIQAPTPNMMKDRYSEFCDMSVQTKPTRGFKRYEIDWMKKDGTYMRANETFVEGEEYIAVIRAYINVDDDETTGVFVNNYIPLGIQYNYASRKLVAGGNYKGSVTWAYYDHVDYDDESMYFYSKPIKSTYDPINEAIEIVDYKRLIEGKTFDEYMPTIQVGKLVGVEAGWYKLVYDKDGKTILDRVLMKSTDIVEAGAEYSFRVVLEADNKYSFDITETSDGYIYNGNIRVPNNEVKKINYSDHKIIIIFKEVEPSKLIKGTEATCQAYGLKDYYELDGKYYSDVNCKNEIKDLTAWKTAEGKLAKKNHDFSKYVSNNNSTHKVVCKECGTVWTGHDKDSCSGGTATCTAKAKCTKCKAEYGSLKAHTNTTTTTKATTSKDGSKVTKCSVCGRVASTTTIAMANTFTLAKTSYEYTGSQIKPTITIKDSNGALIAATNYTLTYGANKEVGKGTVKVTFKSTSNYSGSKELSFKINPKTTTIGTPVIASDGITVKWTKNTTGAGYYIYRSVNGASYTKVKTIESNATVSWKDTTAKTNGDKYQYKIIAYKSVSGTTYTSAASAVKTTYFLTRPTITLTNTSTGVKVAWGKNAKATGYYVYRSTDGGTTYKNIKTITSNATVSYTDTAAKTNGSKYMYKVEAYKTVSSTTYKSVASAVKTYYFISKPAISSLTNSAAGKILVKWARNAKATGYQIQYGASSDFSGAKTVTATGTTSTLSKTIGSLTKGKTYYVRIRSYKTVGSTKFYSAWSDKKSVKIVK